MKHLLLLILGGLLLMTTQLSYSQESDQQPVPTRVPPTPVPQAVVNLEEELPSQSAIARIRESGIVNVGVLYNNPPFSQYNIRGFVSGYDADVANSLASAWGVLTNFVQVTRDPQEIAAMLRRGDVDIVIGALPHRREYDALVEFSQTYYMNRQALMVLSSSEINTLADMANRRVGVVIASPAENAVNRWLIRSELPIDVQTYLTLDQAYVALAAGEVDGIVDSEHRLLRVAAIRPDLTRLLSETVEQEPYAIAMLRQDINLRTLINRTLHYLTRIGRMDEIQQVHFPGERYDDIVVWRNVGDAAPALDQYAVDLTFPSLYVVPRIQSGQPLRVAGIYGDAATTSQRNLDAFHRELLQAMVGRWGGTVEFIPLSAGNPLELVANGQADIALGVEPDWEWVNQVDFTNPYLVHGLRLMSRVGENVVGFADLNGDTLLVPSSEPYAVDRARALAQFLSARIEINEQPEEAIPVILLSEDPEADAAFGDSLTLLPIIQAHPEQLTLTRTNNNTGRWYDASYLPGAECAAVVACQPRLMTFATPLNDIEFRLLIEYTMQEMMLDGTMERLWTMVMLPEDIPTFEIWPGSSIYLGYRLGS
ncbi:MAG: hypothetical protein Kow00117_03230 [Phototrophicales bacterium]